MTYYAADLGRMTSLVDAAATVNEAIARRLQSIEARTGSLSVDWCGEAAEQHTSNTRVWHESMQQMRNELASLAEAIDSASSSYRDTVDHNQRMWPS